MDALAETPLKPRLVTVLGWQLQRKDHSTTVHPSPLATPDHLQASSEQSPSGTHLSAHHCRSEACLHARCDETETLPHSGISATSSSIRIPLHRLGDRLHASRDISTSPLDTWLDIQSPVQSITERPTSRAGSSPRCAKYSGCLCHAGDKESPASAKRECRELPAHSRPSDLHSRGKAILGKSSPTRTLSSSEPVERLEAQTTRIKRDLGRAIGVNHGKRTEPSRSVKSQSRDRDNGDLAFMAAEHSTRHALTSSSWLLHSAASSHVTNDKSILSSYSPLENVTIGIGSRPAIGTGTAELEFYVRSKRTKVTLLNVLYVPSSPHNFLSMGKLHRAGYSITFLPDSLDVDIRTKAGVRLAHCRNIGDVYALGNVIPILPDTEDDYDLPPASSNPISLEGERQSDSEQQSSRSAPISHTTDTTDTRPPSTPGPPKAPASSSPSTPPSSQPRPTAQSSTGQRNASPPRATSLAPTMSTLTPMSSRNATPEQSPPPPKAPRDIDSRISEDNIILGPRTRKYAKPGSAFMARYATVGTTHIAFIATVSTTHPLAEDSSTLRTLTHTSLSNPSSHSRHRLHAPHTKTKFENSARLEFEGEC